MCWLNSCHCLQLGQAALLLHLMVQIFLSKLSVIKITSGLSTSLTLFVPNKLPISNTNSISRKVTPTASHCLKKAITKFSRAAGATTGKIEKLRLKVGLTNQLKHGKRPNQLITGMKLNQQREQMEDGMIPNQPTPGMKPNQPREQMQDGMKPNQPTPGMKQCPQREQMQDGKIPNQRTPGMKQCPQRDQSMRQISDTPALTGIK